MSKISMPMFSYGTLYGTVYNYSPEGVNIGTRNISTEGLYFTVKEKWGINRNNKTYVEKSIGTGISRVGGGNDGRFIVTFTSKELHFPPGEYAYCMFLSESGTIYYEGTTNIKVIGSGVFEIIEGLKYGTS